MLSYFEFLNNKKNGIKQGKNKGLESWDLYPLRWGRYLKGES
jgi:hypothetical protein